MGPHVGRQGWTGTVAGVGGLCQYCVCRRWCRLLVICRQYWTGAVAGVVADAGAYHMSGTKPWRYSISMVIGSRARQKAAMINGRRPYLSDSSPTRGAHKNVMIVCEKKSLHDDQ